MAILPKSKPKQKNRTLVRVLATAEKSRISTERSIPASKAKTHLLELLDSVDSRREEVIITKRGRPVARLIPIADTASRSIFGCMKGTGRITGDIVGPEPDVWNAMVE